MSYRKLFRSERQRWGRWTGGGSVGGGGSSGLGGGSGGGGDGSGGGGSGGGGSRKEAEPAAIDNKEKVKSDSIRVKMG